MNLVLTIVIAVVAAIVITLVVYLLKKYTNLNITVQDLMPIITEIINIILGIEKKSNAELSDVKDPNLIETLRMTGEEKKALAVKLVEENLPATDLKKIKKSPFKTIGKAVEYAFVVFAQPIILGKMALKGKK